MLAHREKDGDDCCWEGSWWGPALWAVRVAPRRESHFFSGVAIGEMPELLEITLIHAPVRTPVKHTGSPRNE